MRMGWQAGVQNFVRNAGLIGRMVVRKTSNNELQQQRQLLAGTRPLGRLASVRQRIQVHAFPGCCLSQRLAEQVSSHRRCRAAAGSRVCQSVVVRLAQGKQLRVAAERRRSGSMDERQFGAGGGEQEGR